MPIVRKVTDQLISMAEDGTITWESIARGALNYMSENEIADMASCEELMPYDPGINEDGDEDR